MTLEDFERGFQPAADRSRVETLATGARIREAETVPPQGPPGVGKTHLAAGLGVRATQPGFSARRCRFDELTTAPRADSDVPSTRLERRKCMSASLPIVDELGFEVTSREEAVPFFRPIAGRYGRGSTPIATDESVRDWTELLAVDEAPASAIPDRLLRRSRARHQGPLVSA